MWEANITSFNGASKEMWSPPSFESSQSIDSPDCGCLDGVVTHSPVTIGQVVYMGDEVDDVGVLAPNPEALFMKDLCNLLSNLEATSPGRGKAIACLLTGTTTRGNTKKLENSVRSEDKKSRAIGRRVQLLN